LTGEGKRNIIQILIRNGTYLPDRGKRIVERSFMSDLNFGADVLWVSRANLPVDWGTKPHSHEAFYHLAYVISGTASWTVEGIAYTAKAGTCINVPPNVSHCMHTEDDTCEIYEIKYAVSKQSMIRNLGAGGQVFQGDVLLAELIAAVYDVSRRRTVQARKEGNSFLAALLHQILRILQKDEEKEEISAFLNTEDFSPSTKMTVKYIDENYSNDVSLEMVSEVTGYNRNYICTVFKRDCGFTVSTYLNYVRVFHAAEMIAYGDYTLQQVCAAVGFNDLSYFTKTFRKIVGIPPGQYRQAFPDDVFLTGDVDSEQEGYTLPVWAGRVFRK